MPSGIPADLTLQQFGRWTVLRKVPPTTRAKCSHWRCICDCGTVSVVPYGNLLSSRSTGCAKCRSHALKYSVPTKSDIGLVWGRVKFEGCCQRWRESLDNFIADVGERPDGCSPHKRHARRPWSPSNFEWGPTRRSIGMAKHFAKIGRERVNLTEISRRAGLSRQRLHQLLRRHGSVERVLASRPDIAELAQSTISQ